MKSIYQIERTIRQTLIVEVEVAEADVLTTRYADVYAEALRRAWNTQEEDWSEGEIAYHAELMTRE